MRFALCIPRNVIIVTSNFRILMYSFIELFFVQSNK